MKLLPAKPRSALRDFLDNEASGGLLLIAAAAAALVVANSPLAAAYDQMLHAYIGPMNVLHWINDALMALFFLLVGLEIKREFIDGHLATWPDRILPIVAAVAGMALPALVYLAIAGGDAHLVRGWAIPAATDIAFAIAVLAILGSRVPASLKLFLTTVAIVDDMGAVAVIALAYTKAISVPWLLAAIAVLAGLIGMNRARIFAIRWYCLGFGLLWFAVLQSGVHATVAGVLAAMTIPVRMTKAAPDAADSPLHRMEHLLQKPVAWAIVPLFGFANAGVTFGSAPLFATLPLAIGLGLFVGKQAGIFGGVWMAVKFGIAPKPAGASWAQIYGIALLCGIGFTMSLFIGGLAFRGAGEGDAVKIGVLAGSVVSALLGWAVLYGAGREKVRKF
ncbi:MAG: Na+/H+ antiporter NhaA [Sphingomonadaceae bacterium]